MNTGWHRDFEPFELAENMEEDLGLFEAATHAQRLDTKPPEVHTVLAVTTAGDEPLAFATVAAERLSAKLVEESGATTAEAIVAAAASVTASLVVVPATVGDDFLTGLIELTGEAGGPSVAIVADGAPAALDAMILPLFDDEPAARASLAWACALAKAAGSQGLVSAVELSTPATRQEARDLLGEKSEPEELRDATVGRAVSGRLGSLVAALQRHSLAHGYAVEVGFRPGSPRREIIAALAAVGRPATVLLGRDRLPAARGQGSAPRLALELLAARAGAVFVV